MALGLAGSNPAVRALASLDRGRHRRVVLGVALRSAACGNAAPAVRAPNERRSARDEGLRAAPRLGSVPEVAATPHARLETLTLGRAWNAERVKAGRGDFVACPVDRAACRFEAWVVRRWSASCASWS